MGENPNARYWDVFSAPLMDEQGNISGFIQIARDMTSKWKAEQALRKSEATLNLLLETIPIPVFYKGREGQIPGVQQGFRNFFREKQGTTDRQERI